MGMTSQDWDEKYRQWEYVWSLRPNRFVAEQVEAAGLVAGCGRRALDWACGEGRNSVWLAENGWEVTAVDFSEVGLAKTVRLAEDRSVSEHVRALRADVTSFEPPQVFDLVVMSYLQLPADERRRAIAAASRALRPGGTFVLVAHDIANLEHGTGGPREPAVLCSPEDVESDLRSCGVRWSLVSAETRERDVEAGERPALDTVARACRAGRVIEVFADVGCAFTHLGLRRLVSARDDRAGDPDASDTVLHVRSWPLEIVNGRPLDPHLVGKQVKALQDTVAPGEFAHFDPATFPESGIAPMALAAAAYEQGPLTGEAVSLELRDLLFERGVPIGSRDVLEGLAEEYGLDSLGDPERVLSDHRAGVRAGVVGSPHFFTASGDYFCPALRMSRDEGGHLHVETDEDGFEGFVRACFGPADPSGGPTGGEA